MKGRGKEIGEKICVERFLNWYNKRHNRNYTYEKATDRFSDLKDGLNWDFVAFERDNPEEWIGIEVKGLSTIWELLERSKFWHELCLELTQDSASKGFPGEFEIMLPPVFHLPQNARQEFLEAISEVLIDNQSGWKVGETKDIGHDVGSKFLNWPTQRSDADEWDKWGRDRPSKLEITKASDSGCKVSTVIGPLIVGDVVGEEKKALNEVFKLRNGAVRPDKQLKLAKEKKTRRTVLLLAGIGVDEGLTKNYVQQDLDPDLISNIDYIYLVDMGDTDRVVMMYPS